MFRLMTYAAIMVVAGAFLVLIVDVESGTSWAIGAGMIWLVAATAGIGVVMMRRPVSPRSRTRRRSRHAVAAHMDALSHRAPALRLDAPAGGRDLHG